MGLTPVNGAMNSAVNDEAELCRWSKAAQHRKSVAEASSDDAGQHCTIDFYYFSYFYHNLTI